MTLYLIKSILCSAIFIVAYLILLEKEKIHTFKRFYLLASIVLSMVIPAITLKIIEPGNAPVQYFAQLIPASEFSNPHPVNITSTLVEITNFNWSTFLVLIYTAITALLLFRFVNSFFRMLAASHGKATKLYRQAMIVTDDTAAIPFTFLNYIFVNSKDAENQQILMHELTHTRQKHTLDILLIELIHCLLWFNPLLFLYKKAIRLNHEFLADDQVVKNHPVCEYQNMLLQKSQLRKISPLASSLTYSITKKRFIMMLKSRNQYRSFVKIIISGVVVCCTIMTLSEKIHAQDQPSLPVIVQDSSNTPTIASEFDTLINKYVRFKEIKGRTPIWFNVTGITKEEKVKMKELYDAMTAEQKAKYPENVYMVFTPVPPPEKRSPTAQEMIDFADPAVYGIWLDGKRIPNAELVKYKPSDIALVWKSRLMKNAAHYGQYKFHTEVMTHAYFDKTFPQESN